MDGLKEAKNIMCCKQGRYTLMEEYRKCDFCSTNYEEHKRCWHEATRRSGNLARMCMRV